MNDIKLTLEEAFGGIVFDETPHKYYDDHHTEYTSVTTFVGQQSQPFDARAVAARKTSSAEDMNKLLAQWEYNKNYSCTLGTELHKVCENLWQRKMYKPVAPAGFDGMQADLDRRAIQCSSAVDSLRADGYAPIATEFVVGDRLLGIAGCIDTLLYNTKTGRFCIEDNKTNKQIRFKGFKGAMMKDRFSEFPDCEYGHYTCQLNIYADLIERNTDIKVDELFLIHFPPNGEPWKKIAIERKPIFKSQEELNV